MPTPGSLQLVTVASGVPTVGNGTVSTLDNVFDATNGPVAVKAASTAAVAADKALVVTISPNGQNLNGRAAAAASAPVVLSNEDLAALQLQATNSLSAETLATNNARVDRQAGLDGVQIVRTHTNLEDIVSNVASVGTATRTSCLPSSGAGIRTYLTSVVLCNTSSTAITVSIDDGTTSKIVLPLPAGSGCVFNPPVPLRGTAATAWQFLPSGAAATVTCSMIGFMSKV